MLPVAVLVFPTDFLVPVYLSLAQSFPECVSFVAEALDLQFWMLCGDKLLGLGTAEVCSGCVDRTTSALTSQAAFPSHSCSPGLVCPSVQTCLRHNSGRENRAGVQQGSCPWPVLSDAAQTWQNHE